MSKYMSYILILGFVFVLAGVYSMHKQTTHVDEKQLIAILNVGGSELDKAIALRDKLVKEKRDWKKTKSIPELAMQMPVLIAYYHEAVANQPDKKASLEKILSQMNSVIEKKSMSLLKWEIFHDQLGALFDDNANLYQYKNNKANGLLNWGNLSFKDRYPSNYDNLPWFIYVHDGNLGVRTINRAYLNKISIVAAPTNKNLEFQGKFLTPRDVAQEDFNSSSQFIYSHWSESQNKGRLAKLFALIDNQTDPIESAKDHLVLNMYIYQYANSRNYANTMREILEYGKDEIIERLNYLKKINPMAKPKAIDVVYSLMTSYEDHLFDEKDLVITKINANEFKVTGTLFKKPSSQYSAIVKVGEEMGVYKITYTDPDGKQVTRYENDGYISWRTKNISFKNMQPLLNILGIKAPHDPTFVQNEIFYDKLISLVDGFVRKYADIDVDIHH